MKNLFSLVIVTIMMFSACNAKTKSVDTEAAKKAVNVVMEKYLNAFNAKDAVALITFLADDGQFYGSDPTEIMNKKTLSDSWTQAFADKAINNSYKVEKREIRISPDGNSAIVVEQFTIKGYTPKIAWRLVSHLVKTGDSWKFDFMSWSFIPKNEDMEKLNKALE